MSNVSIFRPTTSVQERRRFARHEVSLAGTANSVRDNFELHVVDISRGGARLRPSSTRLVVGDWISIQLARTRVFRAQVIWLKLGEVGVRFLESPEIMAERFAGLHV